MRNYLLFMSLCLLASLARAQERVSMESMFPKSAKYYLKGESVEIPYDKLDSVLKAFGGPFALEHRKVGDEERVYLVKADPSKMRSMRGDVEAKINEMNGTVAPSFELKDINGKKYALNDLKGKVVVLNFWFTACVPCAMEMPELNKLKEKYKGKDVVFLAIGLDKAEQVKSFLKEHTFDYTILCEGKNTSNDYRVSNFPTSMVIDRTGVIRYAQLGGQNIMEALTTEIDKRL